MSCGHYCMSITDHFIHSDFLHFETSALTGTKWTCLSDDPFPILHGAHPLFLQSLMFPLVTGGDYSLCIFITFLCLFFKKIPLHGSMEGIDLCNIPLCFVGVNEFLLLQILLLSWYSRS